MSFLNDLDESLSEETEISIKIKGFKETVKFRVMDCNNKGIHNATILLNEKELGKTNKRGYLNVKKEELPEKGKIKAIVGIYSKSENFNLEECK